MASEQSESKEIVYTMRRSTDYRLFPVNGVWGGPTPTGEVRCDFIFEAQELPDEIAYMVTPDGLGPEVRRDGNVRLVREAQVGVVMSIGAAKSIGAWLIKRAEETEARLAAQKRPMPPGQNA